MRQAVSRIEEVFPFPLPNFDTGRNEIDNDTVRACAAGFRQGFHPAGDVR
jgi:hypothetical protein